MATIVYKPVCSNCGAIITDEVYGIEYISSDKTTYMRHKDVGISPSVCKECGALFESIMITKTEIDIQEVQI